MELHQHFMNIALIESSVFEIIENTPNTQNSFDCITTKFIKDCFEQLKAVSTNKKYLDLLRLLLCKRYKLNYESDKNNTATFCIQSNQFMEFLFHSKLCTHKEYQSILFDIVILQLVLLQDQTNFIQLFENFRSNWSSNQLQLDSTVSIDWYLKVLNCFLSTWELIYFLNDKKDSGKRNKKYLQHCKEVLLSSVMNDLKNWIRCKETNEWHALYSVLSKVITIGKDTTILSPYLHNILDKNFALTTLCAICNFIFPIDCSNIEIDYNLINNDKLWSLVQDNLLSTNSYNRKQALQLLKRLIDFISENEQNIKKSVTKVSTPTKIKPLMCNQIESGKLSIKQISLNFILIIEALEEKQKHLVIPYLSLVDSLIEGYTVHKSCGNCYDFSWIHCIFARIFMHGNNTVVKWGLQRSLKLNAEAYNCNSFIGLIIKVLNNTFLYEKYNDEIEPNIITALTSWFNDFQSKDLHLVEKFICLLGKVPWGPIAIYYILQSLYMTSDKLDTTVKLEQKQLDVIRILVETNIKLHPPMLRSMSQVTLIKILSRFSEIQNLSVLCNILSVFDIKDIREPCCWPALVSWLAKIDYPKIEIFITQVCETLAIDDENVQLPMSTFALIIQLFYEGKLICQTEQFCAVTQKLTTLLLYLDKVDVRPYVQVSLIIKIIDFLYNLFDLYYQFPEFIYKFFITYKETIFRFIYKMFNSNDLDYKYIKIYMRALKNINYYENNKFTTVSIVTPKNRKDLEGKCLQVLNNTNEYTEIQLLFALQSWSTISHYYKYEDKFFLKIIYHLLKIPQSREYKNKLTGKMGQDYYIALSKLIKNHVLTLNTHDLKEKDHWLHILSSIFDAAGNQVLIYFGDILHFYSTNILLDNGKFENFKCLIQRFWNCNFNSKREKIFWLAAQKLTECINSLEFLNCKSLKCISEEFSNRMLSEGDALPGLKYILLTFSAINKHFNYFMEIVFNGLVHGQVMRRDQRINMQTSIVGKHTLSPYKLKDGKIENFKAYDFLNRQYNMDATVRAAAVLQLSNALYIDTNNASLFLPLIIKKLSAVKNKRYFANSQLHRLKHRIYQILLILQPNLNKKSTEVLYNTLCDSIIRDSDQHSIRLMIEWLLIRIYLSNQNLLSDLWLFFDKVCDERPSSVNSIIGIIWHIAQQLSEKKQIELIKIALPKLGICCMKQQFGTRLFGHVFFIKLYEILNKNSDISIEYSSFYKATLESLRNSTFKKTLDQINEHFFYTIFNPIQHYTLETIYFQLPRLSNVSFEEWISKENFEDQIFLDFPTVELKIQNVDNTLNQAVIPSCYLKCSETSESKEMEYSQITTDIQKKMIPWKVMLPNDEEFSQMTDLSISKDKVKNKKKIIIVASLIDKSQNLGGIARTCEIFGVKELVISNLKQIEDKEFQFLSVSADKWIKIVEVKSFLLDKYLIELKDCGWTLIGAEQTVNSINLFDLKFPEQTALILGNEKNGIPANILPLLDICVEIPQFGVIRSLNVHVTSAICIWEYFKQHQI